MKKYILFFIFPILFLFGFDVVGQSPDAIAIRVIPNNDHYSAQRWYKEKGFKGSPQSMLVDGYEAVRDGRTVYVNAANIAPDMSGVDKLWTNIYLISFNQQAERSTQDIFGQILSHWKFNTNRSGSGICNKTMTTNCVLDADCPLGEFCMSEKARIIRDTRRLADLAEITILLDAYHDRNDSYPKLSAGSYIKNKTLSVWPSWQGALAQDLKSNLVYDPINKLGACPGYNEKTCWDEKTKAFSGGAGLVLPADSRTYAYAAGASGQSYELCAAMETNYVIGIQNGACSAVGEEIRLTQSQANRQPYFTSYNLPPAGINEAYTGNISASDPDGDSLTWSLSVVSGCGGWSSGDPRISPSAIPNQQRISAANTGSAGACTISVSINDGRGGNANQNFTINVENSPPLISAGSITYQASTTRPLSYTATAQDQQNITFSINPSLMPSISSSVSNAGNTWSYRLAGQFSTANGPIYPSKNFSFNLTATDSLGANSSASFTIRVINDRPVITTPLVCSNSMRLTYAYPACTIRATDPNGNLITGFNYTGLPAGLSGSSAGVISGTPTVGGSFVVRATAVDEYGAESLPAGYNLSIDTFCGDGVKQTPNSDGRGGPTGNGQENCDGTSGVATSPADSSASKRYQCTGGCTAPTGPCAGTCTYTGGYCGDGNIDSGYGEQCEAVGTGFSGTSYGCTNCQWSGGSCGDGVKNGPEQCDGTSGIATSPVGSASYFQYGCTPSCTYTGGWCGDSIDNGPEQCDGTGPTGNAALTPADSAIGKQYGCQASCQWIGGYCGDSAVQSTYGEQCDTAGGGGTSATDQWACTAGTCQWTGGFCGNGTCEAGYEDCASCTVDCGPCCTDDCTAGATRCISDPVREVCANFDPDTCVEWGPADQTYLVNGAHTQADCTAIFGTVVSDGSCNLMCRTGVAHPLSNVNCTLGWSQYQNWSTTHPAAFTGVNYSSPYWACTNNPCNPSGSEPGCPLLGCPGGTYNYCSPVLPCSIWDCISCTGLGPGSQYVYFTKYHNWSNNGNIETCSYAGPSQGCSAPSPVNTYRSHIGCY